MRNRLLVGVATLFFAATSCRKDDCGPSTPCGPVGPTVLGVGAPVTLTANATDPDGDPLAYFWDFGDGGTSTQADPQHSFTAVGSAPQTFLVRLTVSHEDLERDPQMLAGISGGWPAILSNLKTLLETGSPLPRSPSAA